MFQDVWAEEGCKSGIGEGVEGVVTGSKKKGKIGMKTIQVTGIATEMPTMDGLRGCKKCLVNESHSWRNVQIIVVGKLMWSIMWKLNPSSHASTSRQERLTR